MKEDSPHTVRPVSRRGISKLLIVVVFVAAGALVYRWGLATGERSSPSGSFTSTARIHQQTALDVADSHGKLSSLLRPAPEDIQQRISSTANLSRAIGQSDSEVGPLPGEQALALARQKLQVLVTEASSGEGIEISLTYTGSDARHAAGLVNTLAENYARDCREEWKKRTRPAWIQAKEASERAHQEWLAAKGRLESLYEQQFDREDTSASEGQEAPSEHAESVTQTPETSAAVDPPTPAMIDNPQWLGMSQRLAKLQQRETELLTDRTPAHPEVQDTELRIAALQEQLATIARKIPGKPSERPVEVPKQPLVPTPSHVDSNRIARERAEAAKRFQALRQAEARAGRIYEEAARAEQEALRTYQQVPQIEVHSAQPIELSMPQGPRTEWALLALISGLAMAAGTWMISTGTAADPILSTIAQAEATLPLPILGTIPPSDLADRSTTGHGSKRLGRASLVIGGLILIAGCAAVVIEVMDP